jgi:hypothetical protein
MPDNKEVEIEVALKDSTSAVLKQISQEIDNVSRKLVETGRRGSDAFERMKRGADQSGGGTKGTNASLADMNTIMGNLAKSMLGPAGIAAGFTALTRAMGNFATQRVQIQALSTDLGFTVNSISVMDRTFKRMGMTFEQGRAQMGAWSDKLRELATYKTGSQLYRDLVAMGEKEFADKLMKAAGSNIDQARDMMLAKAEQTYREDGAARGRHYTRIIATNESTAKSYRQTSEGVKAAHQARYSDSVEYLKKEEEITNTFNTLWVGTAAVTIKALNEMDGGMFGMNKKLEAFGNNAFFKWLARLSGASGEPSKGEEVTNPRVRKQMGLPDLPPQEGRAVGGPVYSGRAYMVGERGPEVFSPGQSGTILASLPAGQTMRELSDTEKDSNRSLREIRDLLQKMDEEEEKAGGGTGASGSSGGATQSDTGGGTTGDGAQGGEDGVTMGGDGGGPTHKRPTRGDRNNNPGNIKYGPFAREHGATGRDEQGHAIFPDRETGFRAAEALLGTKAYAGKSLREIGRRWQQAGPGWAATVSKATGIPLDAPLTPEQRSQVARIGIPRAEGTSLGPGIPNIFGPGGKYQLRGEGGPTGGATGARQAAGPMGERVDAAIAGGAFGGRVLERQRAVAGTRKGALDPRLKAALDYASSQTGLTVDVTSGGQRMPGVRGAVGSHRHDRGRAADFNLRDEKGNIVHPNDPRAIAFYEHAARAGVTGGGAGYMSDRTKIHLDIESEHLRSPVYAGGRQFAAAIARGKAARREQGPPIPPEQARRTVDGSQLGGAPASGKVTASVDFGNMPKPEEKNRNPFFRAKIPMGRMHSSVREGATLPGDESYGQWVP